MKDKKGWIRIAEAFVAVLLIAGVLLVIIGEERLVSPNPDSDIYDSQLIILRSIQLEDSLRTSILEASVPVDSSEGGLPQNVEDKIIALAPDYLECEAKICEITSDCDLDTPPEKNIYVQKVIITVTETQEGDMTPRQLKLFCWMK